MSDDQSDADEPGKAPYDQLDIEEDVNASIEEASKFHSITEYRKKVT